MKLNDSNNILYFFTTTGLYLLTMFFFMTIEYIFPGYHDKYQKRRRLTNIGSTTLLILLATFLRHIPFFSMGLGAAWAIENKIGLLNVIAIPLWLSIIIQFFLQELLYWVVHFGQHRIHFLWRTHMAHHGDPFVDCTSGLRMHPMEIVSLPLRTIFIVIVGIHPLFVAAHGISSFVVGSFAHANIKYPPLLNKLTRKIICNPSVHRLHHSTAYANTKNFGNIIPFWDIVFGTFSDKEEAIENNPKDLVIGIKNLSDDKALSLKWILQSFWEKKI